MVCLVHFPTQRRWITTNTVSTPLENVKYLTVGQVADVLQVSRSFIMARLGEFEAVRCGRVYRIPDNAVHRFVFDNRVTQSPVPLGANPNSAIERAARAARRIA